MTPDEMLKLADEADKLAAEATPGPWHIGPYYKCDVHSPHQRVGRDFVVHGNTWSAVDRADAPFIAASRTLVPQLAVALRDTVAKLQETPSHKLEKWLAGNKSRHVQIEIDDGYGARSWDVTLGDRYGRICFHLDPSDDNLDDAILGALAKFKEARAPSGE